MIGFVINPTDKIVCDRLLNVRPTWAIHQGPPTTRPHNKALMCSYSKADGRLTTAAKLGRNQPSIQTPSIKDPTQHNCDSIVHYRLLPLVIG